MPPANPMAVFEAIPADATAFVVVRNLKELNNEIQRVAAQFGFVLGPNGMFPAPLDLVKMNLGITGGLSENSSLALVVLSCRDVAALAELEGAGKLALLIPCHDVDALTAAMAPQKEGDLLKINLMDQELNAAVKGDFLVVGKPQAVKTVLQAKDGILKTIAPDRVKAYNQQDLFAWFTPAGISKEIRQEINEFMNGIFTMGSMTGDPEAGAEYAKLALDNINKVFDEMKAFALGLNLDAKAGLTLNVYSRAKEGTEMAQHMAAAKPADKPLLTGVPDEPFIITAGFTNTANNPYQEKQIRMALDMYEKMAKQYGLNIAPEKVNIIKESIVRLFMSFETAGFSISALSPEGVEGLIGMAKIVRVTDSKQSQADVRKLITTIKEVIMELAKSDAEAELDEEDLKTLDEIIVIQESAEKTAGAVVDHFIINLEKIPSIEPEDLVEIKNITGMEGVLIRIAAVGKNHIVVTFGGGPERFTKILELVSKGQAPLADSPYIKSVANRIPTEGLIVEGYISVENILRLVMNVTTAVGQPLPMPLMMRQSAPIAFTGTKVDQTAQQMDILIPMELVLSVKDMVMPMITMMMMGGGPGQQQQAPAPGTAPAPDEGL
jgi:hypothetical protein